MTKKGQNIWRTQKGDKKQKWQGGDFWGFWVGEHATSKKSVNQAAGVFKEGGH